MALDSANFPSELSITDPPGSDPVGQADDQIRTVKRALNQGFPNVAAEVSATDVELNTMAGITATTAELNIMDGITADTAELNIMDGCTATTAELNKTDGLTATTTELNYTDGVTSNIQTQLNTKGTMTSFLVTGDSGGNATITQGETLDIAGGTNCTSARSGDTVTVNVPNATKSVKGAAYIAEVDLNGNGYFLDVNTSYIRIFGTQTVSANSSETIVLPSGFTLISISAVTTTIKMSSLGLSTGDSNPGAYHSGTTATIRNNISATLPFYWTIDGKATA